jgi:hypothetical protein
MEARATPGGVSACRFRTAGSCAVRSAGPAQICPFWVLVDHAIEAINRRVHEAEAK